MDAMQTAVTSPEKNDIDKQQIAKFNPTFWVAMLALLMTFAVTAAAFVYAHNVNALLKHFTDKAQLTQLKLQQLQGIQITTLERIKQQQQQLAKRQLLESGSHRAWLLAEVDYLVRLANYNLSYGHDIATVIALLQTADQRVAQLNDPKLNQLRQSLANNITALQAAGKLDVVGILAKLSALQLQVKQLPLISPPQFNAGIEVDAKGKAVERSKWRKAWDDSLATLKALVIIRHHQKPIEPLLGPEQFMYLQQNLQLQLQQAQWAVLHGQQAVYSNGLQQAITWVKNYYASASPQTSAFIQNIEQLQKINLQPALPDLSSLLTALAQVDRPTATVKASEEN